MSVASRYGAASLLKAFPILFIALKLSGACYLAYLGFKLLQSAFQTWSRPTQHAEMADLPQLDKVHPYRTALSVKLANFFKHNYKLAASGICLVGLLFFGFGLRLATSTIS
ncbi:UNVERIFIED_CONTAM: putative membrane protein [Trichonephila clavipes]